ncbi:hypothetical protein IVB27_11655 [Bradyrhizobium sp. 197]|uniref:DUF6418 domain-containing protein n=1 Tax=Bradyrhizobium sp. 197 TaxID=2782663 RepID=UPI001FF7D45F|nr:DUF6418 domain-containing protein [Bradyrhizobium sp. 197]MCK1475440.1 hypothetical protein [Bradyrhizobium sp. 197]
MPVTPEQIAVALSAGIFCFLVLFLAAYRPVIFLGFFFILFTLVWRTASMAFIDLTGPVWSSQTLRYIGPGLATPLYVLAYCATLVPFLIVLRPSAIRTWPDGIDRRQAPQGMLTLSSLTVVLSMLFLAYLFLDMLRHGSIPLFAHIERYTYTAERAGAAHRWLATYGNFLAFWWGLMFAAERLRNDRLDLRYLGLLATLLGYMFLAGNRFSAFYSLSSFFVIPLSAVFVQQAVGRSGAPFHWVVRMFGRREIATFGAGALLVVLLAAGAIFINLVSVRGYEGEQVLSQFWERVLVQPSELGWISYERVFLHNQWQPDPVYDFLFQSPLDPNRNTSPQYLMLQTIGEPRTSEHLRAGVQLAGGFPEIFFELFGPIYAWPFLLGSGCIAALLTALIVKGTIQGRYASAFLALYVLFGFDVMYIGGMLNFVIAQSYWIKIAALAIALLLERSLAGSGLPLLPWSIAPIPRPCWLVAASRSIRLRFQPQARQ